MVAEVVNVMVEVLAVCVLGVVVRDSDRCGVNDKKLNGNWL